MKLIIDIPDMIYNILNGNSSWKGLSVDYILNAVKDGTPLEAQPNRCDICKHSEERDGSNCYECVKGMGDNFEAQPTDEVKCDCTTEEIAKSFTEDVEAVKDRLDGQPCEDCISREQAVYVASGYCAPQNIADELRKLPAVQIQMKRGFWKEKHFANYPTWHECSICGFEAYEENGDEHLSNFCPNCGAALKEGENS